MRLSPDRVERFYAIWKQLILFVNQKKRVEPTLPDAGVGAWNPQQVYAIREALWADDEVRAAFIAENPAHLSPADLAIVESWDHRVAGTFCIFRHLKKHSLLIREGSREVYGVLGLASALDEVVPFTPCYAQAVLLPFEEQIIYDSLVMPYNVYLGPGIRRDLADVYKDARERAAVVTSLLPRPVGRAEEQAEAHEVDARVLAALRKHLYRAGLSPKVVERDVAAVAALGDYLAALPEPRSLRDFDPGVIGDYLVSGRTEVVTEARHRQGKTGLTRFLRFLRDTGRMDYDTARFGLDLLKG
jgi:hypothetical protein